MLQNHHPNNAVAEDPGSYPTPALRPEHLWWSSRKEIVTLRKKLAYQWLFASLELWIVIFLVSTLYLGTGRNPSGYAGNLDVALVDFDKDEAGKYFLNSFRQTPPGNLTLHWRYKYPSDYNNNLDETRRDVDEGQVWAIVVLRFNTSRLVNDSLRALTNGSNVLTSPFTVTPPLFVIYESGRNSFTVSNYVLPPIRAAIAKASAEYAQRLRQDLIANLSATSSLPVNRSLQLLNTFRLGSLLADPLNAQYQDLHPASPFVGQLATTLGYIYIYLITGMIVGAGFRFVSPLAGKVHFVDLLVFRIVTGTFHTFIITLIYSLIVLWFFGIDSGSLFMRYWMFNWLSASVFAALIAFFTINLGSFANSLLTVFVILMLAGATIQISIELSPRFYRYGYGLPLYHILNGGRHLLFGSHSRFALDVGVLLIYFGVLLIVALATSILWAKRKERKLAQASQEKPEDKPEDKPEEKK